MSSFPHSKGSDLPVGAQRAYKIIKGGQDKIAFVGGNGGGHKRVAPYHKDPQADSSAENYFFVSVRHEFFHNKRIISQFPAV